MCSNILPGNSNSQVGLKLETLDGSPGFYNGTTIADFHDSGKVLQCNPLIRLPLGSANVGPYKRDTL